MRDEYIDSLETAKVVMNEKAWREWIKKEIKDALEQDENTKIPDVDEVIKQLWEDGYVTDRFEDEAKKMMNECPWWDNIVALMDDDIREKLNYEIAPCTNEELLIEYMAKHYIKFDGDMFEI